MPANAETHAALDQFVDLFFTTNHRDTPAAERAFEALVRGMAASCPYISPSLSEAVLWDTAMSLHKVFAEPFVLRLAELRPSPPARAWGAPVPEAMPCG